MPIYEYRCVTCGHQMEAMQKISDAPLTDCPNCGNPDMKKLISAAGFRLKGSGWYETDFKSGQKRNVHDSGASSKKDSPAKKDSPSKKDSVSKKNATSKKNSSSSCRTGGCSGSS